MRGFRADNLASKRTAARAATATIGSGANGVVTVTATTAGAAANTNTIRSVLGSGNDVALSAAVNSGVITVTLGTDGGGLADDAKNTATLVAAAVDGVTGYDAVASGSGATPVPVTSAQSFAGGHDVMTVRDLAKAANVTDELIQNLERGGNCDIHVAQRIADALSETLATLGTRF